MDMQDIVRQLHACLYPENYLTLDELECEGYAIDANGVYQWDADTLDNLAMVFQRNSDALVDVLNRTAKS